MSNSFATGGGGTNFETRVQASFVVLMLTGGFVPCYQSYIIKKIILQGRHFGYATDDLIIHTEAQGDGQRKKLLVQVKHAISITERDPVFNEVIQAAWHDFSNAEIFTRGKDSIVLITGPLNIIDTNSVRPLLERSRSCENREEFFSDIERAIYISEGQRKKLEAFRSNLKRANYDRDVSDEELFQFLKHFHLLGYDLDMKAGVTLSLLHSLIGQYSENNAQNIWSRIVDEVQTANQNAGTITIESISEDIRNAFQRPESRTIPSELAKAPLSKTNWNQVQYASELAVASLLCSWNENSDADKSIVSQLAKEDFDKWIPKIREVLQYPDSPLSLKNGIWAITERKELWQEVGQRLFDDQLDRFKQCVKAVLTERDPKLELVPKERYAASIHGKILKYSRNLRKGLAESLALLGTRPDALTNCSIGKPESIPILAIRDIFDGSDWVLWGSLNDLLPLLAEASPNEFLRAVESALQQSPCPFDQLFTQEGKGIMGENYLTGLFWALETLAWDEKYLVQVTVALGELASHDPGGHWANRPSNSLTTIFLPWFPQTTAPVGKRKVAIQTLQRENPQAAWKLLLSLLPNQHQMSSGSRKPTWLKVIPEDWSEKVAQNEYLDQITLYGDVIVEMAIHDHSKLEELVGHLDDLPAPSFKKVLEILSSKGFIDKPENERIVIWKGLMAIASQHESYTDAKWALDPDIVAQIKDVASRLAPLNRLNLYSVLFGEKDIDFIERRGKWQEQLKKLEERRQLAIKEIIDTEGIEAIVRFADMVESPSKVGYSLGLISGSAIDDLILPDFLEAEKGYLAKLAIGFVSGRFQGQGWAWVSGLNMTTWRHSQIGQFLICLPFTEETWKRVEKLLGQYESEYWGKIYFNPYQAQGDLYMAVDKLLEYGRPNAAIICLYRILHDKQPLDKKRAIKALFSAQSSNEPSDPNNIYHIVDIIKALQDDPTTDFDALFRIEWNYLPLLDGYHGASPKLLENRLATDPSFFCEVIRFIYHSKKEPKSEKKYSEREKAIAQNAYRLLYEWRTPPGIKDDGSFSGDQLNQWLNSVKTISLESGHLEMALTQIGKVLIHCPPDPNGFWINLAAAEALNSKDAEKMRRGFYLAIINSRGVHSVDPSGKPEFDLAAKYDKQAEALENAGYQRLAVTMRRLAESYTNEAKRVIDEARQDLE